MKQSKFCKICGKKINFRSTYCLDCCRNNPTVREKINAAKRGKRCSISTEFKKGNHPPTEFKKGCSNLNKGKSYEEIYGNEKAKEIKAKQSKRRKEHPDGKASSNWKGGNLQFQCENCGKIFEAPDSSLHPPRFCTWECWENWRSQHFRGKEHPSWRGGIAYFPYCEKFNFEFKERVREFFERKCYLCGKSEEEAARRLSVHHVNYDKNTCCNEVAPLFVPLCAGCHRRIHIQEEGWEEFFTVSLNYLTGGQCFDPRKSDGGNSP